MLCIYCIHAETPRYSSTPIALYSGRNGKLVFVPTEDGTCAKKHAHKSSRANHISKRAVAYERDVGAAIGWCDNSGVGSRVRSYLVMEYMAFTGSAQKSSGRAIV